MAAVKNLRSVVKKKHPKIQFGIPGFDWKDLHSTPGLKRLFECYKTFLRQDSLELFQQYEAYLLGQKLLPKEESNFIVNLAVSVSKFLTNFFQIQKEVAQLKESDLALEREKKVAAKIDYQNLVRVNRLDEKIPERMEGFPETFRRRDGFNLTDKRMDRKEVLSEVDYCLYCHAREKDSCAKGLRDRKTNQVAKNPLGITLAGCPLDQRISESHDLRKKGDSLAALATILIDNPMCPGTGHRICNDCMKSCIYQKQEPVNIPQIETNILTQVLNLPYGFEIYSLLTRFNPLNRTRPHALPYNGKNILIVGMGPAGYTLAHYLLNEGFGVVGIDGLKIEPLPSHWIDKVGFNFEPVADVNELFENMGDRVLAGFGGVAEYGITARWDKNFLKLIHLNLARRDKFSVYGGIRFGGTITIDDAWNMGFDHIAMATGAGKPTIVPMKNNLIRGVRKASDFLMALQLTGASKRDNMANLQIRLPAIVIGGGLTGIDAATEIMAYYPIQAEKILHRYEVLEKEMGRDAILSKLNAEGQEILAESLIHGREIRAERARARRANEKPDLMKLVRKWGGASLIYRKTMHDSPAYRLNHEEIIKALEEGIYFIEKFSPVECHRGQHGSLDAVTFERQKQTEEGKWRGTGELKKFPAKTLLVAAGTSPNIIYEREQPGTFQLDEWKYFFKKYLNDNGELKSGSGDDRAFFSSYNNGDKRVTFYGDNHPDYAGNVVRAMTSAKFGYPKVVALFEEEIKKLKPEDQDQRDMVYARLIRKLDQDLLPTVVQVNHLTKTIVEVVLHAPQQVKNFQPGQFFRLQNYEADVLVTDGTKLLMEGVALTGAWTDEEKGLLGLIVLEMGVSSRLCATLKPDQRVVVMGPTGAPTHIPQNETVLLLGGGLGNAVLFSIAAAMKKTNNRVLYFAGYKNGADVFKRDEIEKGTDVVIWSNDTGERIIPRRTQDKSFTGNIIQAMLAYAGGKLGEVPIRLNEVDRIIAIGSDRMMAAVKEARFDQLKPYLKTNHIAIGSINSTMQCMMKEVCAQCLQRHVDPKTGTETKPVFSCFNQDQELDQVDFQNLNERLQANHLQEILSNLWLDHLLKKSATLSSPSR